MHGTTVKNKTTQAIGHFLLQQLIVTEMKKIFTVFMEPYFEHDNEIQD